MESDSKMGILSIVGKIVVSKQISNLSEDTRSLTENIKNVGFSHCNKTANTLTDKLAKKAHFILGKKM